jgi:hypothetical protein
MPDGRTRGARGLVEVDDALLGGDERGECRDRLRDRSEPNGVRGIAVCCEDRVGACDSSRGEGRLPALDLVQSLHRGRY